MAKDLDRRVYRRELEQLTGWCAATIRRAERRGAIPAGRIDQGGRRKYWTLSEARAIVAGASSDNQS